VEKHINKILDDLDIVCTTQVDDLAVVCPDPSVAQGLIDSVGKIVALKSRGILNSFNGFDIGQRHQYVTVSCQSFLGRMLKAHGWDKPSPTKKSNSKPIESLAACTAVLQGVLLK
jgi:hypothetical protein